MASNTFEVQLKSQNEFEKRCEEKKQRLTNWLQRTRTLVKDSKTLTVTSYKPAYLAKIGHSVCVFDCSGRFTVFTFRSSCKCCSGLVTIGVRNQLWGESKGFDGNWMFSRILDAELAGLMLEDDGIGTFIGCNGVRDQIEILDYIGLEDVSVCRMNRKWVLQLGNLWDTLLTEDEAEYDIQF